MGWPESIDSAVTRKRGLLELSETVTIVFAGDPEAALNDAKLWWGAVYEPAHGTPTIAGRPVFTVMPQVTGKPDPLSVVREHHDHVVLPALTARRSVFCVGAWWREPAIIEATDRMPLLAVPSAWPSVGRIITVDVEPASAGPGSLEMLSADHMRLTQSGPKYRLTAIVETLCHMGLLVPRWDLSREARKPR